MVLSKYAIEKDLTGVDWSNKTFDNRIWKDYDLSNVNFMNTRFDDCVFEGSLLRGTTFSKGYLKNVIFKNCVFEYTYFKYATLENCTFINCTIDRCAFDNATLYSPKIGGCKITNSSFDEIFIDKDAIIALSGIYNVKLSGKVMEDIDIVASYVDKVTLSGKTYLNNMNSDLVEVTLKQLRKKLLPKKLFRSSYKEEARAAALIAEF